MQELGTHKTVPGPLIQLDMQDFFAFSVPSAFLSFFPSMVPAKMAPKDTATAATKNSSSTLQSEQHFLSFILTPA